MNRLDVYTAVHKMQRSRLCELILESATSDPADAPGRRRLAAAVEAMIAELHAHAEHEDRFIHPLLRTYAPDIAAALDAEHAQLDASMAQLRVASADHADGKADPNDLHRALATFASQYFAHVGREEREALPALWATCSDAELAGILTSFHASRTDVENLTSLLAQLPTLNPEEIARFVSVALDTEIRADIGELLATLLTPAQLGAVHAS